MVGGSTARRKLHDLVELFESWPPITLAALARNTEALRNYEGVLHCGLIKWIRPCRLGYGKDGCQMREIVTDCRRSYFNYQFIGKSDHIGACDFRTLLVGYVVVLDRPQSWAFVRPIFLIDSSV